MTRKQYLQQRRERNAALTRIDRANRCATCRRNLFEIDHPPVESLDGQKFCSKDCADARSEVGA